MRARYPDSDGFVERNGARIYYEVYENEGRHMDYEDVQPDHLAAVMSQEIDGDVDYMDVETDGAARAAAMIAELI